MKFLPWFVLGGVIVMGIFLGVKKALHWNISMMHAYLAKRLGQIYFCDYSLWDIYSKQFFLRYSKFVDWGFCAQVAAMSMLALKDNPMTRYVYARASDERLLHCWVEFYFLGVWYVIDPCWCQPFVMLRRSYYRRLKPTIRKVCNYEEFWSYPISQQFHERMLCPETSWLLVELMFTYGFDESDERTLFCPDITKTTLYEDAGKHINIAIYHKCPQIIISRRIVHDMMQKPTCLRPKARQIRKVKRFQRKLNQSYEEFLRTQGKDHSKVQAS